MPLRPLTESIKHDRVRFQYCDSCDGTGIEPHCRQEPAIRCGRCHHGLISEFNPYYDKTRPFLVITNIELP